MKLITKEIIKKTPHIGAQANVGLDNLMLYVKLFHPISEYTWYIAEANFETGECFGLVCGFEKELGYFDLNELEEVVVLGLKVERDLYFKPTKYYDVMKIERLNDGE